MIDDSLAKALGFPHLDVIRDLFAREPGLSSHDINKPDDDSSEHDEDDGSIEP